MNKVSIALCTFNGEKFLPDQLESYLRQSCLPDELIVCDDVSTDLTVAILREFKERSPFPVKIYVNEDNLGSTKNFEKAIELCSGDIIFLSDQDDIWHPEKIEVMTNEFDRSPSNGLLFCDANFVKFDLEPYDESLFGLMGFDEKKRYLFNNGQDFKSLINMNLIIGCAAAFRSDYKELICPIPTGIPMVIHDYWIGLVISAVSNAKPILRQLVDYRQHDVQQTGYRNVLNRENKTNNNSGTWQTCNNFQETVRNLKLMRARIENVRERVVKVLGQSNPKVESEYHDLDNRIRHFSQRARIQQCASLIEKSSKIFPELVGMRYHRYSRGFRSALKDLVM